MKPRHKQIRGLAISKRLDRLSSEGRLFIICAIISIVLGIFLAQMDNLETSNEQSLRYKEQDSTTKANFINITDIERKYRDSLEEKDRENNHIQNKFLTTSFNDSISIANGLARESKLENQNLQLQLDSEHKENMRLQQDLNSPTIEEPVYPIGSHELNPLMTYDSTRHQYTFFAKYLNSGKGDAEGISTRFYFFDINDNYMGHSEGTYEDTSVIIHPDVGNGLMTTQVTVMRFYILFEVKYKNHFGRQMPPFIKVYYYDVNYINKDIPLVPRTEAEKIRSIFLSLEHENKL
jgi:hypothetical protein